MNFVNRLFYALCISIGFLIIHIFIVFFKLGDSITLFLTLTAMVIAQVLAFVLLKNNFHGRPVNFMDVFLMLGLTMGVSIILLSLNSALNPYVDHKPLIFSDILVSLLMFAGLFSLITTAVIWFFVLRGRR
jgi:F0F1-type ATP synthase assembly protein I